MATSFAEDMQRNKTTSGQQPYRHHHKTNGSHPDGIERGRGRVMATIHL
eukprot:CAMPEP_0168386882 /NCGR_PEP_ID=MMETSP0228-20121227/15660_1 /TAXON_ID=133427 /ORGANISM="Protoceratium reticulatum, Strain CCCM 535 (=CCMP 1889)" /LENGTH=48 /DNA_ID= /DNA_START= /DNA_END= /DNA_ORIENTATION=